MSSTTVPITTLSVRKNQPRSCAVSRVMKPHVAGSAPGSEHCCRAPSTVADMSEGQFSPSTSMYVCSSALPKWSQLGFCGSKRRGSV